MSEPFIFTDAPQHQTGEELKQNAKPPRIKRELPPVEVPVEDDLDVVLTIVRMIQHRGPHSRARILIAIRQLLDS